MSADPQREPARAARPADQARNARTGAATKLRYLHAAAELAAADAPGRDSAAFAVSRVRIADVAADLGVARTTLYKWWPSQLQFWSDLTIYIATTAPRPAADEVTAAIMQMATGDPPEPAMEHVRIALNAVQQRRLANPWSALRTALLGYAGSERIDAVVGAANSREIDEAAQQLDRVFAQVGVAPREPLTSRDIAVGGFCIADGLAAAGRLCPRINREDIVLDGEPAGWGMLAFAVRAVIRRCTRARTAADHMPAAAVDAALPSELQHRVDCWTGAQRAALAAGARRLTMRGHDAGLRRPTSALGHVTLAGVARHANVSRQWLHRIWPSQQAFAADLITHLFEERCERILVELRRAAGLSMEHPFGGALVATEAAFGALTAYAANEPMNHLTYAAHDDDPAVREGCRRALESMLDRFAADLEATTRTWGGGTRDGLTPFHLAALIALTELAAARLERTNPGSVRTRLPYCGGEWSAIAIMLDGIVAAGLR